MLLMSKDVVTRLQNSDEFKNVSFKHMDATKYKDFEEDDVDIWRFV